MTYHVNIVTFSYSVGEGNFSRFVLGCRDFVSECSHVNMLSRRKLPQQFQSAAFWKKYFCILCKKLSLFYV